jgi:hypothetical protein
MASGTAHHPPHVQFAPDLLHINRLALIGERALSADYECAAACDIETVGGSYTKVCSPGLDAALEFVQRGHISNRAVAPRAIAALVGRFLPRLGPLAIASGPFFLMANSSGSWASPSILLMFNGS